MTNPQSINIFSVGNPLYGDDGVGKEVAEQFIAKDNNFRVNYYDAGTDALSLIDRFKPNGLNIIIDAAKMGKDPGAVIRMDQHEVNFTIKWDHLSLHGFGLAETFKMAELVGTLPEDLIVIGIEPEKIRIGEKITKVVEDSIPTAVNLITREVNLYESKNCIDY
jgi:hydrogenase maturation protease